MVRPYNIRCISLSASNSSQSMLLGSICPGIALHAGNVLLEAFAMFHRWSHPIFAGKKSNWQKGLLAIKHWISLNKMCSALSIIAAFFANKSMSTSFNDCPPASASYQSSCWSIVYPIRLPAGKCSLTLVTFETSSVLVHCFNKILN